MRRDKNRSRKKHHRRAIATTLSAILLVITTLIIVGLAAALANSIGQQQHLAKQSDHTTTATSVLTTTATKIITSHLNPTTISVLTTLTTTVASTSTVISTLAGRCGNCTYYIQAISDGAFVDVFVPFQTAQSALPAAGITLNLTVILQPFYGSVSSLGQPETIYSKILTTNATGYAFVRIQLTCKELQQYAGDKIVQGVAYAYPLSHSGTFIDLNAPLAGPYMTFGISLASTECSFT